MGVSVIRITRVCAWGAAKGLLRTSPLKPNGGLSGAQSQSCTALKSVSRIGTRGSRFPGRLWGVVSANFERIFLRGRGNDVVHAQIFDDLAVMNRDVPDSRNRHSQSRIWSSVRPIHTFESVLFVDGGEDFVSVVRRIVQVLQQFSFSRGFCGAALFAMLRRSFAFDLIEESIVCAGDVLD